MMSCADDRATFTWKNTSMCFQWNLWNLDWKINTETRSSICLLRNRFAARPGGKTAKDKAISHYLVFCVVVSQEPGSRAIFIVSPISFLFYRSKFWPDNSTIYARVVVHANGILSGEVTDVCCALRDSWSWWSTSSWRFCVTRYMTACNAALHERQITRNNPSLQCTDKGSMVRAQYCSEWTELGYCMARLFDSFVPRRLMKAQPLLRVAT